MITQVQNSYAIFNECEAQSHNIVIQPLGENFALRKIRKITNILANRLSFGTVLAESGCESINASFGNM